MYIIYILYIYIYIYIYIYEQETSVCMCCVAKINKKHVWLTNFRILLIPSHVCEWLHAYNLYIKKNTITIAPRGNFTKETNNF